MAKRKPQPAGTTPAPNASRTFTQEQRIFIRGMARGDTPDIAAARIVKDPARAREVAARYLQNREITQAIAQEIEATYDGVIRPLAAAAIIRILKSDNKTEAGKMARWVMGQGKGGSDKSPKALRDMSESELLALIDQAGATLAAQDTPLIDQRAADGIQAPRFEDLI